MAKDSRQEMADILATGGSDSERRRFLLEK